MKIAIASGKGGTGKTTVATNLAFVAAAAGRSVHLLDCDVEEPNCHIFVKPDLEKAEPVCVLVPAVDEEKCTGCGECAAACQFKAIACLNKNVLTFPEMCHGCGACWIVCPAEAITQDRREVGVLEQGVVASGKGDAPPDAVKRGVPLSGGNGFRFTQGRLRIGEAMSPPLIRKVKAAADSAQLTIIDAPPGTSCPVVTAVKGSDFVCLVTEPTPFGLNDLMLAVAVVRELKLPMGIVSNRADIGDGRVREYCRRKRIPLLAEIPDDRRVAEAYSRGQMVCEAVPEMRAVFESLLAAIERCVRK